MTLRAWWQDIAGLWRGLPEVIKAQRLLAKARSQRREGHVSDAFRLALQAFVILRSQAHADDPAAKAIIATDAVLLDELAKELGHASATRDDVAFALGICEDAARVSPRLQATLQQHIDWYRHRLSEVTNGQAHETGPVAGRRRTKRSSGRSRRKRGASPLNAVLGGPDADA